MSDQHTTEQASDEQVKETVAAVGFVAVLAAMAGGLGLVIAAMAVGVERAWTGRQRRNGRDGDDGSTARAWRAARRRAWQAVGEGWRQAVADQRAWLDMDRGRRQAWRQERRRWWQAGADPGSRPRQPAAGVRAGRWARRAWARVAVAADRVAAAAGRTAGRAVGTVGRFRRGWREGWRVADQVRRDGGGFRDIAGARPRSAPAPGPQPASRPVDAEESARPAGGGTPPPSSPPPPREQAPPRTFRPPPAQSAGPRPCPECGENLFAEPPRYWRRADWGAPPYWSHPGGEPTCPKTGQPYRPTAPTGPADPPPASTADAPASSTIDGCDRCGADAPVLYSTDAGGWECLDCVTKATAQQATPDPGRPALPADPNPTTDDTDPGGAMSAPAITAGATAPQGETNLDLTVADLAAIHSELDGINEQIDELAQRRANLQARIAAASERVAATGGTAATAQALDAATAVADELGQHLGNFSASATEASDVTAAAEAGLVPARDAQDELHAAGARGEFVSAATD